MGKQNKGIDYPKYINHKYFNNIDTEEKAYFLGLLYADGNISIPKDNRQITITLGLQEDDKDIVIKFCKEIAPTKNIKIHNPPSVSKNNWKKRAVFKFSSNKIGNSLINLGCLQNKSHVGMSFNFSKLDEKLHPHFIRGFFDGDGCLYVKKEKNKYTRKTTNILKRNFTNKLYKKFILCSTSKSFLEQILKILQKNCNLTSKPQWKNKLRTEIVYFLSIEGQKDIIELQEYLYKNATVFMKRKFNKFNMSISSQAKDISFEGSTTT